MNFDIFKDLIRAPFKNRLSEELIYVALDLLDDEDRQRLLRFTPQPRNYTPEDVRRVFRYGFELMLQPSNYFQWHHFFGLPDPDMKTLDGLARSAEVVLDVGANIGLYSLMMARRNPSARVISLEPNPQAFERLAHHVRANLTTNITPLNIAAGRCPGELDLYVAETGDTGKSSLQARHGLDVSTTVDVVPIDDLVKTLAVKAVDLIKIDVEGFEPEVLLGARSTIEKFRPALFIEFTPRWYMDRRALAREAIDLLVGLGYVLFDSSEFHSHGTAATPLNSGMLLSNTQRQYNVVGLIPDNAIQFATN